MSSLETLVAALNESLTPSSSPPCEALVECTASSFGKTFIGNVAQKLNWSADQIAMSDQLFTTTFFTLASVNGLVTEQVDQADVPQLVFTTSSLIQYIEYLTYMLGALRLFITDLQQNVEAAINNNIDPNAYIASVTALHEFAQLTQYVVVHFDTEIPLAKNAIQVPALSEQLNPVFSAVVQLYNYAGSIYNDISQQNDPSANVQPFKEIVDQLMQVIPALITMITEIKDKLMKTVISMYPEPAYDEFQQFLKSFAKSAALMVLINVVVGMYNQSSFHLTLSVLKILTEQLHIIISKVTRLLRFRGDFEPSVKQIRAAHKTMGEIFKPLIENMIQTVPMLPVAIKAEAEKSVVEVFQTVQKFFEEFPNRFDNLLETLKKDRRFSVFQGVDDVANSAITQEAIPLIESTVQLTSQILAVETSIEKITASVQAISTNYTKFTAYITNAINTADDHNYKARLTRQRDYITSCLNQFVAEFKTFTSNPDNFLFKTLAGAYAANFALSTLTLDLHPILSAKLSEVRDLLITGLIQFYKSNLKVIIEILSLCYQRSETLKPEDKAKFDVIFPYVMSTIQEATPKFLQTSDTSNPDSFTQCIHESDKVHNILVPFLDTLNSSDDQSLSTAKVLLATVNRILVQLSSTFRYALLLSFHVESESFIAYIVPFLDIVQSLFAVQTDMVYQRFLTNKKPIDEKIDEIRAAFETLPPLGVYEASYMDKLSQLIHPTLVLCLTVITDANPLTRSSGKNPMFKKCNQMLGLCITSLKNLFGFKYAAIVDMRCALPSTAVKGYDIRDTATKVGQNLADLVQKLQSDPQSTPSVANAIARDLYKIYEVMVPHEEMKEAAEKLKKHADDIDDLVVKFSMGDQFVTQELVNTIQEVGQAVQHLQQLGQSLIDTVNKAAQPAQEDKNFTPEQAQKVLVETGKVVDAKGKAVADAPQIPSEKEVNDIFMLVNSSPEYEKVRGPMNSVVDALKKKVETFRELAKQYNENPSPEILEKMKKIAAEIKEAQEVIQRGAKFNEADATPEAIEKAQPTEKSSLQDAANFAFMLQAATNEMFSKDSQEAKTLQQIINEGVAQFAAGQPQGLAKLQLVAMAQQRDMQEVEQEVASEVKEAAARGDVKVLGELIPKLLIADQIYKVMNPATAQQHSAATNEAREVLLRVLEKGIAPEDIPAIVAAVEQFEAALHGGMSQNTAEISDSQLSDTVMDLNTDITTSVSKTINDLKKLTANDKAKLDTQIHSIKHKSISLVSSTLVAAIRRAAALNKDDVEDLTSEVDKLLDNLKSFEKTATDSLTSTNKATAVRNVGKVQRDITINLSTISSLCDNFVEIDQTHDECYTGDALQLTLSTLRLAAVCDAPASSKASIFKTVIESVKENFATLKDRAIKLLTGTEDLQPITDLLNVLEGKVNGFNGENITFDNVIETVKSINEIRSGIDQALNTEVKQLPEFVSKLPFRFSPAANKPGQPRPVADIMKDAEHFYNLHAKALEKLSEVLNNTRSTGDDILAALNEYHQAANRLLQNAEQMRNSTWNPACQSRLLSTHTNLISIGDAAIDACRARFLAQDNWRNAIVAFIEQANEASKNVKDASQAAYDAIQQDLSATNEAEKELIIAAQNIQKSQGRLMSFKSQAEDQKVQLGANYIGVEIIDVSAPILNTSARLIEAAQAQMKYCLARKPNLENQTGMINTARNLVDSLDLIIVAAEAIVNNDPDAINKVLAACNIISSAIAHFQAECRQKEGSLELNDVIQKITDQIQETIVHVRNFGETAQRKQQEEAQKDVKQSSRALNKMIEKLNAEAKVVEAKRALEDAENKLKIARQKK